MAQRHTTVTTPLGGTALLFHRMVGTECLGQPFEYRLELAADDEQLKFEDLLGQSVTVKVALPNGGARYFNGLVSRFSQTGRLGPHVLYRATLRPWLSFLTRTSNCRIFQDKTPVDIIKAVFRDRGFTDFDEKLSGSYSTMNYCVQYRESDFNFVSRLMEHEGIYYYFRHEDGKHTLVLSDSYSSHDTIPGYGTIPYYPPTENVVRSEDHISEFNISKEVQSGAFTLNDFDFEKPRAGLLVKSSAPRHHPLADYEVYDYPGDYYVTGQGNAYVDARLRELQSQYEEVSGKGNPRGLMAGGLFKLTEFPRDDQNREYLVVSVEHDIQAEEYRSAAGAAGGEPYSCTFTALDSHEVYRPPRIARRPIVQGPQTAVVVGKSGEEIWTDKYGRVKVQFHWDREGKNDENSSCWVRVAQVWAGKNWGGIQIPRIGQEVIIDFLEGDPDRPIITGRVYNADNMPPYGLPAQAVVSGLKSNSTKGGGGYNEYVFDDTKGDELIREHGEKDKDSTIKHDLREHVHNNRSRDVGVDEMVSVGKNQTYKIGVDQTGTIGSNKTITVGANHTETIGASQTTTVVIQKTETVGVNKTETIGAAKELTIGAAYQVTVGAVMRESVGTGKTESIGAEKSVQVGKDSSEAVAKTKRVTAGESILETADKDIALKAGKKGLIDIGDELTIKCGDASITMKKDGTITIKGKGITVKDSGAMKVEASKDLVMKGSKILQN